MFLLAALASSASAQSDYHVTQDPHRLIYINSAFAHGHRHGYEEGFHAGDEDYHFRRQPSVPQKLPRSKGYEARFGDKKSYMDGFASGFAAGYADSYSGRVFHPAEQSVLNDVLFTQPSTPEQPGFPHDFNFGVAEGYREGFANGDHIADEPGVAQSAAWRCHQQSRADMYCAGYGTGYLMGRADSRSLALIQKTQPSTLARNSR